MAALSSKLVGPAGLPTVGLLANKGRILAVGAVNLQVGSRTHLDRYRYLSIVDPRIQRSSGSGYRD